MLYEKKMLILSGDGKGVVLIEKSAVGVKFSLRTFDMPTCGVLRAGVITKTSVSVRDLPAGDNPAAVFSLDAGDISSLHFAVFDKKLRLYGCIGSRMWEANVMDLLCKADRRAPDTNIADAPLPPIAPPPKVLPLPDGTGIPQSRLALYGDEALSEENFYTPVAPSRMRVVDSFLDSPRAFDELAPRIEPKEKTEELVALSVENGDNKSEDGQVIEEIHIETADDSDEAQAEVAASEQAYASPETSAEASAEEGAEESIETSAEDGAYDMPWQLEAKWIKSRSHRAMTANKQTVRRAEQKQSVKHVRDTAFFEIAREDIENLFAYGERDGELNSLISDFEWIKVDAGGNTISVGRGEGVLCYAVKGTYSKVPPLGEGSQWAPIDANAPTGKGYWLVFQNMIDGTIIK